MEDIFKFEEIYENCGSGDIAACSCSKKKKKKKGKSGMKTAMKPMQWSGDNMSEGCGCDKKKKKKKKLKDFVVEKCGACGGLKKKKKKLKNFIKEIE